MIEVKYASLDKPIMVCQGPKCRHSHEYVNFDSNYQYHRFQSYHYPQLCHDPCYFKDSADIEIKNCEVIDRKTGLCKICEFSYELHKREYYKTTLVIKSGVDITVHQDIKSLEDERKKSESIIDDIHDRCEDLNDEREFITKCTAKFSHYLANNAIVPYDDSFKSYMEHLIENEKSLSKNGLDNREIIEGLKKTLNEYEFEKNYLVDAQKYTETVVSTLEIVQLIKKLENLTLCGNDIIAAQKAQDKATNAEITANREVICKPISSTSLRSKFKKAFNFFGKKIKGKDKKGQKPEEIEMKQKGKAQFYS
jgi:hypothetical protein